MMKSTASLAPGSHGATLKTIPDTPHDRSKQMTRRQCVCGERKR